MTQPPDNSMFPRPPSTQPVESVQALDAAPRAVARPRLGHFRFELPAVVMESVHWTGTDADRFFSLEEPTFEQLQGVLATTDASQLGTKVPDFVRSIGKLGSDDKAERMPDGSPVMQPIEYVAATAWLSRLGTKGKMMVVTMWTESFAPSNAEGEALRGSKVRLG